jgi:hypothetical protein
MRAQLITATLALSLVASAVLVEVSQAQNAPKERVATPGLAASGEVLTERDGVLRLNTTPCRGTASVTVFRRPYVKEAAGEVNCKGARRSFVQVVQR